MTFKVLIFFKVTHCLCSDEGWRMIMSLRKAACIFPHLSHSHMKSQLLSACVSYNEVQSREQWLPFPPSLPTIAEITHIPLEIIRLSLFIHNWLTSHIIEHLPCSSTVSGTGEEDLKQIKSTLLPLCHRGALKKMCIVTRTAL